MHFLTISPVKIRGGAGEISGSINEALPTTEFSEYIWWPATARLLSAAYNDKRKKETDESVAQKVIHIMYFKLKALRHTCRAA